MGRSRLTRIYNECRTEQFHIIHNSNPMDNNIRIIPIQDLCMLCGDELLARDTAHGLAYWLCRACIRLLSEQVVLRELEQQPKIVRV
jgi:hypothetical protein